MSNHISIIGYFLYAGLIVKSVMFILLLGSILSWTFIFERAWYFRAKRQAAALFLKRFWGSSDLGRLYADLDGNGEEKEGMTALFYAGFKEYWRRKSQGGLAIEPIQRVIQIEIAREEMALNRRLAFFASVGSIAPYIGLFGTVWGIMTSFQALGQAQQATIAMVAPGISEALVATALGLFTAIPAVLAYNRYSTTVGELLEQYELFEQEFIALVEQQTELSSTDLNLRTKGRQARSLAPEFDSVER